MMAFSFFYGGPQIIKGVALILLCLGAVLAGIMRIYNADKNAESRYYQTINKWRWAAITAAFLLIGWLGCSYGWYLCLTAFDRSFH
jgi:cell division protein FtsW (lipid II flippase)